MRMPLCRFAYSCVCVFAYVHEDVLFFLSKTVAEDKVQWSSYRNNAW